MSGLATVALPWWLWPLIVALSLALLIVEVLRYLDERTRTEVMR